MSDSLPEDPEELPRSLPSADRRENARTVLAVTTVVIVLWATGLILQYGWRIVPAAFWSALALIKNKIPLFSIGALVTGAIGFWFEHRRQWKGKVRSALAKFAATLRAPLAGLVLLFLVYLLILTPGSMYRQQGAELEAARRDIQELKAKAANKPAFQIFLTGGARYATVLASERERKLDGRTAVCAFNIHIANNLDRATTLREVLFSYTYKGKTNEVLGTVWPLGKSHDDTSVMLLMHPNNQMMILMGWQDIRHVLAQHKQPGEVWMGSAVFILNDGVTCDNLENSRLVVRDYVGNSTEIAFSPMKPNNVEIRFERFVHYHTNNSIVWGSATP
jgi:hypothetical protein